VNFSLAHSARGSSGTCPRWSNVEHRLHDNARAVANGVKLGRKPDLAKSLGLGRKVGMKPAPKKRGTKGSTKKATGAA